MVAPIACQIKTILLFFSYPTCSVAIQFIRLGFGILHDQMLQVGLKYFVPFLRLICYSRIILFMISIVQVGLEMI